MKKYRGALVSLAILLLLVVAENALAQVVTTPGTVTGDFRTASTAWIGRLFGYAQRLFALLAIIQFAWSAALLTLQSADLQGWVTGAIRQIMWVGVFYTLLLFGPSWMPTIVNSFIIAGQAASGTGGFDPTEVFGRGVDTAAALFSASSDAGFISNTGAAFALVFAAIGVLICFTLMAVQLVVALVESYIVISAGVIFLGFGGSRWTVEYVQKYIGLTVNVGVKLFVIYLMIGIIMTISRGFLATAAALATSGTAMQDASTILGSTLMLAMLIWTVPKTIATLIGGSPQLTGGDMVSTTAGAGTAIGTAVGGAAMGMSWIAGKMFGSSDGGGLQSVGAAASYTGGGGGGGGGGNPTAGLGGVTSGVGSATSNAVAPPATAGGASAGSAVGAAGASSGAAGGAAASSGIGGAASGVAAGPVGLAASAAASGLSAAGNAVAGAASNAAGVAAQGGSVAKAPASDSMAGATTSTVGSAAGGASGQTPPTDGVNPSSAEQENVGAAAGIGSPEALDGGGDGSAVSPPSASLGSPQTVNSPMSNSSPMNGGSTSVPGDGTTTAAQLVSGATYQDDVARSAGEAAGRAVPPPEASLENPQTLNSPQSVNAPIGSGPPIQSGGDSPTYRDDISRSAQEAATRPQAQPPRGTPLADKAIQGVRTGMDRLSQDGGGAPPGVTPKLTDE